MSDVEKVIHDLEQCLDDSVAAVVPADTVREVIALLKAQEPRVLTLDEYRAIAEKPAEERVPVWLEWRSGSGRWTIPERAYELYGESWRCWTSRPTGEQREATAWESLSTLTR